MPSSLKSKIPMEEQEKQDGRQDSFLWMIIAFLLGVIAGFFIAPVKEGMTIGCENGNNNTADWKICNKELSNHE